MQGGRGTIKSHIGSKSLFWPIGPIARINEQLIKRHRSLLATVHLVKGLAYTVSTRTSKTEVGSCSKGWLESLLIFSLVSNIKNMPVKKTGYFV